jgi:hypothetical protein
LIAGTAVLSVIALLASVGAVLAAVERGLFRGRLIVALFLVVAVGSALLARAAAVDGFPLAAAGILPVLAGLVFQEMNDTFGALAAERRRSRRRRRRRRPPTRPDWWVPAEVRDRDRPAA